MANYFRSFYYLYSLLRRARWNESKLKDFQDRRLREIVSYSYDNVDFYRRTFRDLGIKPSDIRSRDDLKKLPILRKDEIRNNMDGFISKEYNIENLKKVSTSGSTGKPLFLYLSKAEDEFRKAKHLRANIALGQKFRDHWVTLTSPHHFTEISKLQKRIGVFVPRSVSVFNSVEDQLKLIEKEKPDILDGYASSLLLLAQWIESNGTSINPRFLISGAELLDKSSREYIEKIFGVPCYDQYASIEMERIAWQCPDLQGYHMEVDNMVLQFLDKNGEEVASGEHGEIVCTSLFNYAMPLIKYAVGDIGTPSDQHCSCGRTLPLMKVVDGRKDSFLILPNGQTLSPRSFTIAISTFSLYNQIEQFRVVQKKVDFFEIQIKTNATTQEKDRMRVLLDSHLREIFRLSSDEVTFDVIFVDEIPLDKNGKLMMVVSELDHNLTENIN